MHHSKVIIHCLVPYSTYIRHPVFILSPMVHACVPVWTREWFSVTQSDTIYIYVSRSLYVQHFTTIYSQKPSFTHTHTYYSCLQTCQTHECGMNQKVTIEFLRERSSKNVCALANDSTIWQKYMLHFLTGLIKLWIFRWLFDHTFSSPQAASTTAHTVHITT